MREIFSKKRYIKILFFSFILLAIPHLTYAQLSGNYTIDSGKSASAFNYKTFASAINDLKQGTRTDGGTANGKGVKGAVTFSVANGTYAEQLVIRPIVGASAINRITFKSASGDSSKAIIMYGIDTTLKNPYILTLDSADYITFRGFTFTRPDSVGLENFINFRGYACFNEFLNNKFIGRQIENYIIYSSDSTADSFNTFRNNYFKFGGAQIYFENNYTALESGIEITGNIFDSSLLEAISVSGRNLLVANNKINNIKRIGGKSGLFVWGLNNTRIINNIISTYTDITSIYDYAIILSSYDTTQIIKRSLVANNIINGSSGASLFLIEDVRKIDFFHNTLINSHSDPNSTTLSIWSNGSTEKKNLRLINNHIINKGQGIPLFIDSVTDASGFIDTSDYNNIFAAKKSLASQHLAFYKNTYYDNIATYSKSAGFDKNSFSYDPWFINQSTLKPQSPFLADKGIYLTEVKQDITGKLRDTLHTDIGAYEYDFLSFDAGISTYKPDTLSCNEAFQLKIQNLGKNKIDSISIKYKNSSNTIMQKNYLAALNSGKDTVVKLDGLFLSDSATELKIYISKISNGKDLNDINDTISGFFTSPMHGKYIVGSTGKYKTINAAVKDLLLRGVCDTVRIQIENGNYNDFLHITEIAGSAANKPVIFESKSADKSKVYLGNYNNYFTYGPFSGSVFYLDGTNNIIIQKLSLNNQSMSPIIFLSNGADNNIIKNNALMGNIGIAEESNSSINNLYTENNFDCSLGFKYIGSRLYNLSNYLKLYKNYNLIANIKYADSADIDANEITKLEIESPNKYLRIRNNNFTGNLDINSSQAETTEAIIHIDKNKINGLISIANCLSKNTSRSVISNNMIWANKVQDNHIKLEKCENFDLFHNTVYSGKNAYRTLYINNSSGIRLFNNILFNDSTDGHLLYIGSSTDVDSSDYNLFSGGSSLKDVYFNGNTNSIYGYLANSGFDKHSKIFKGSFESKNNLHIKNKFYINNSGKPYTVITDDIDGNKRDNLHPDIGADEFDLPRAQISMVKFSPALNKKDCGKLPINIQLKNSGIIRVDSIKIAYFLNNILQHQKWYKINLFQKDTVEVFIDSVLYGNNEKNIKLVSSLPNNMPDSIPADDTLRLTIKSRFSGGIYTLGTSTSDFKTFKQAIDTLTERGICGPVVFKIADGIYSEQPVFPGIDGTSKVNTITFEPASGDSTKVIITASTKDKTIPNYAMKLYNATHYKFRNLTIRRTGDDSTGTVLLLSGGNYANIFENNIFIGSKSQAGSFYGNPANYVINSDGGTQDNKIKNNIIKYGYHGMYLRYSVQDTISNNIIDSFYHTGILCPYAYKTEISSNKIQNITSSLLFTYGIGIAGNVLKISNNKIFSDKMYVGISISTQESSYNSIVSNNMVAINGYGMGISSGEKIFILNNSIAIMDYGEALRLSSTDSNQSIYFNNNILTNYGSGKLLVYSGSKKPLKSMDNNVYYKTRPLFNDFINFAGKTYYSIEDFSKATGFDKNSFSVEPEFLKQDDLHTRNILLWKKGKSFNQVTDDFDNDIRKTLPDIGADEMNLFSKDVRILSFQEENNYTCGDSQRSFTVQIVNNGLDSIDNIPLFLIVDNKDTFKTNYTGKLGTAESDYVTFSANYNTNKSKKYSLLAYSKLTGDGNLNNDTLKKEFISISEPVITSSIDDERCGAGKLEIVATDSIHHNTKWYESDTSATPFAAGDTLRLTLTESRSYFAASYNYKPGNLYYDFHGKSKDIRQLQGSFFSIKAKKNVIIDSFAIHTSARTSRNVRFYYKKGNYSGYESSSSNWTNGGTITVNGKGEGQETFLRISSIKIPADSTYSFYIFVNNDEILEDINDLTRSNNEIEVFSGSSDMSFFDQYPQTNHHWNGAVFYRYEGCESVRKEVKASIHQSMIGSIVMPSEDFSGYFSTGIGIDSICANKAFSYQFLPPKDFTNKQYNLDWKFSNINIKTPAGNVFKDTSTVIPEDSANFILHLSPTKSLQDSTLIISWRAENINTGCYKDYTRKVYLNSVPEALFYANNICFDEKLIISDSSKSKSKLSYLYTFGDGTFSTQANPIKIFPKPGLYTITQKVRYANGCIDSFSRKVKIFNLPEALISSDSIFCIGSYANFEVNNTAHDSLNIYKWNFGDGYTDSLRNTKHIYTNAGKYFVSLKVINQNGCTDSTRKTIIVEPLPVASFSANSVCENDFMAFTNNSVSASSYFWKFGDGETSTDTIARHLYNSSGKFQVTLFTKSDAGCVDSISKQVEVYPKPKSDFIGDEVCLGDTTHFKDLTPKSDSVTKWVWFFGDGDTSALQHPVHKYNTAGNYKVVLLTITKNGCVDTFSRIVQVHALPNISFTSITDELEAQFFASDTSFKSYEWSFGDDETSFSHSPNHKYNGKGTYTVKLVVEDKYGCRNSVIDSVFINPNSVGNLKFSNSLFNVYPNPFSNQTTITYYSIKPELINLSIYDMYGKSIALLDEKSISNGKYIFNLKAGNLNLKPGLYIIRLQVGSTILNRKIIYTR